MAIIGNVILLIIAGTLSRLMYAFIAVNIIDLYNVPHMQAFKTMHVWALLLALGIARGGYKPSKRFDKLKGYDEKIIAMWINLIENFFVAFLGWAIAYIVYGFV